MRVVRTVASNGWMNISQVYWGIRIILGQPSFRYSDNIELICLCLNKIYFVFNTSSIKVYNYTDQSWYQSCLVPGLPQCLQHAEVAYARLRENNTLYPRCIHDGRQCVFWSTVRQIPDLCLFKDIVKQNSNKHISKQSKRQPILGFDRR